MATGRISTPRGIVHVRQVGGAPQSIVLFVHGDRVGSDADPYVDYVWGSGHRVADQIAASGANVLAVGIEAPTHRDDEVVWPNLGDLLKVLEGMGEFGGPQLKGLPVVAVAHSRGYTTVAKWLENPRLKHVVLLDALFGSVDKYKSWAASGGDLVTVGATGKPLENTKALAGAKGVTAVRVNDTHMGVVTHGQLIPRYVARAAGGGSLMGLFLIGVFGYLAWQLAKTWR